MAEPDPATSHRQRPVRRGRPPSIARLASTIRGWSPAAWVRVDVATALALFVVQTGPVASSGGAVSMVFGAAATLPLAVRRRWPVPVLVVVLAATVAASVLGVRFTPLGSNASPALALAGYSVAVASSRVVSWVVLSATVAITFATAWIATFTHPDMEENAVHTVAALVGWSLGDSVRARRRYRTELETHRQREIGERTQRALAEQRLRISREVHDVVSHNLSVIAVRAGVGRMLFSSQPAQAHAALAEVETISRSALTELRRLLASVRENDDLSALPQLSDLPALLDTFRASGLDVGYVEHGNPRPLPDILELSAYRIVQEALTNVVKHAGSTRAEVIVDYTKRALHLVVTDAGRGTSAIVADSEGGWGLVGMRERTALFGGSFTAGPLPDAGFRVAASLPVYEMEDAADPSLDHGG